MENQRLSRVFAVYLTFSSMRHPNNLQPFESAPLCPVAVPEIFCSLFASQNFDRCHSFLLPSSATGGGRKRPHFDTSPSMLNSVLEYNDYSIFHRTGRPVMSCCGARNFLLAIRFAKFRPLPLLFAPFIRHRHANPKTHFVRFEDPCAAVANVPTSIRLRTPMCSIPHRPLKCKGMAQHSPKKRGGIIPPRQDLLSAPAIPS